MKETLMIGQLHEGAEEIHHLGDIPSHSAEVMTSTAAIDE